MPSSTFRSFIGAAVLVASLSPVAEGQILRRPVARKSVNWVGANIGITQGYTLNDGTTGATWEFGSGVEYAGRFEHPTGSGISVGAQASYASLPLSYSGSCGSCDAKATVTQLMGLLHYGQGYSFHGVYELSVGAVGYSNFRRETDNTRLGVNTTDYDFRFALGYGLGFGLSPNSSIEVIQEIGTVLHQKTGLPASTSNYPRVYVTRLGGKISF